MAGDRVQRVSWPPRGATRVALAYYVAMAFAFFAMSSLPLIVIAALLLTDAVAHQGGGPPIAVKNWVPILLSLASCVGVASAAGLWFRKPWASPAGQVAMLVAGTYMSITTFTDVLLIPPVFPRDANTFDQAIALFFHTAGLLVGFGWSGMFLLAGYVLRRREIAEWQTGRITMQ